MVEVAGTLGFRHGREKITDGGPELVLGPRRGFAEQRFELGEQLLDRIEVGRAGRQVEQAGANRGDRFSDAVDLVSRRIVEHHDITRVKDRRRKLLDLGAKGPTGHRAVQHQRGDDPVLAQPGDKAGGLPMPVWHGRDQALIRRTATVATGHVGGRRGLVEEQEASNIHVALPDPPAASPARYIGTVLLGRPQALFSCRRPRRRKVRWMVDKEALTPKRASSARISAKVMSGLRHVIRRNSAAWATRIGRR